jgi:hypothetical protein
MVIEPVSEGDLPALRLSKYHIKLVVIPALGGKISSICWRGLEFLARNTRKPFRHAVYAASYAQFDASGFDECFPTIGPCNYPKYPWQGFHLPDHGEVWSLPWHVTSDADSLTLETGGVRLPYKFQKRISIEDPGSITLQYTLTNHSPFEFHYLWSAHPLFAPNPGMRLCLPPEVRVLVDWSKHGRLGEIWTCHNWPHTQDCQGNLVDLSLIHSPEVGWVDKLYTTPLTEGWCAIYDPANGSYAAFVFSPEQIPFVGLSINQGGWPLDEPGYYNIGLEPCNGFPDRLDLAMEQGEAASIRAYQSTQWSLRLLLGTSIDQEDLITRLQNGAAL